MKKLTVVFLLVFLILGILVTPALADTSQVITFGANLSEEQKNQVARVFGVEDLKTSQIPIIEVTNEEERSYLKGLVPDKVIGTKAISSSYVEILEAGSGIKVETYNITWVTKEMYANALATANVKDARVIAAAPFPVSGTAAITGIIKSFEKATGEKISEEAKKIANEELVKTGELGQDIGKDKAAQLMMKVKEQVIADKVKDPEKIRQIVINVAGDLNINLNDRQIDDIVALMQKINKLDLNIRDITGQLKSISLKFDQALQKAEETRGIIQRILDTITDFINRILRLFQF